MAVQKSIFNGVETRKLVENNDYTFAISSIGEFSEIREVDILPTKSFEFTSNFQKSLIIPLVGSCQIKTENHTTYPLNYEQILALNEDTKPNNITILNNLDSIIKVLVISLDGLLIPPWQEQVRQSNIHFTTKNEWATVSQFSFFKLGIFESRFESKIAFEKSSKILLLTLKGSFEINGRLVNVGDSLYLEQSSVEFEALSENSMLLIINV